MFLARYGRAWREQRRFCLSTLRNFGLGKKSLEQWVTEEATCLCADFAKHAGACRGRGTLETGMERLGKRWRRPPDPPRPLSGRPLSPSTLLNKAVSNVIASLTYGRRFEYDDPRLHRLMVLMQQGLEEESGFLREVRGGAAKGPCRASSALKWGPRGWGGGGRGSPEGPGRKASKTKGLEKVRKSQEPSRRPRKEPGPPPLEATSAHEI